MITNTYISNALKSQKVLCRFLVFSSLVHYLQLSKNKRGIKRKILLIDFSNALKEFLFSTSTPNNRNLSTIARNKRLFLHLFLLSWKRRRLILFFFLFSLLNTFLWFLYVRISFYFWIKKPLTCFTIKLPK